MVLVQEIADYQLRELAEKKIYINKYDLSLKYNYELEPYWKALFYDIVCALYKKMEAFFVSLQKIKKIYLLIFKRTMNNL